MTQLRIPALLMRGGSSKGLFFLATDLPSDAGERDALLLRAIGSPDPFGTQTDGLGGATSSTSKVVIIAPSSRPGFDVDYLFGAVPIDRPVIDWSGNCGNLSSAVGPFAIARGLVEAPRDGLATVRIWQANIGAAILARVPMREGEPVEEGDFVLDGVAFPGAEIALEFQEPDLPDSPGIFPTGRLVDRLELAGLPGLAGLASLEATLILAGNPTIFVRAADLGLSGLELPSALNGDHALLGRLETVRAVAAVAMGLASSPEEATERRPHTPKLCLVAPPASFQSTAGRTIEASSIDLSARIVSMGRFHHAMTGTGAVALAAAAAIPGTLVSALATCREAGLLRFGHPAGSMIVGAEVEELEGRWIVRRSTMSRSARTLMDGFVCLPPTLAPIGSIS